MAGATRFERLLDPLQIKKVKLRNRMVKPAQATGYCETDGLVNEREKAFYESLAKGASDCLLAES